MIKPVNATAFTLIPSAEFGIYLKTIFPDKNTSRETLIEEGFQTYIVPIFKTPTDIDTFLEQKAQMILELELKSWQIAEEKWPRHLTKALLNQWFEKQ